MGTTGRTKNGLLRHDGMIVANAMRFAFSSWGDRLLALAMVSIAVGALRTSLSHRSFMVAGTAIVLVAGAAGAAAVRAIGRRLDFHAQDGLLAADALAAGRRRHYSLSIHALAIGVVTICASIADPAAAIMAPFGYLTGAGFAHIAGEVARRGSWRRRTVSPRAVRPVLQRPSSGALAAIPVLLVLLGSFDARTMTASVGLLGAMIALMLTTLDHDVIRFMKESGFTAGKTIRIHARPSSIFLVITVSASLALSRSSVAVVAFGAAAAALLLIMARVLAYRIQPKLAADTLVSICVGVACLAGVAAPMLSPLVVIAALWYLYRRSAPATWLLL